LNDVRLAIVGLGPWGRNLLRAFSAVDRVRIAAVCDGDRARLAGVDLGDSGSARRTALADVLADDRIDAVVLATPPAVHAAQCLAALEAGKHAFVEKPMTLSSRDAGHIVDRARASRCKLMVGHILRYHPAFVRLTELVSSGELGRIRHMHCARLGAAGSTESAATWWALAPHDVSAMRAVFGAEVTSVSVAVGLPLEDGHRPVRAALSFANGCRGTILVSSRAETKTRRMIVVGSKKTAVFDDMETAEKLRVYSESLEAQSVESPFITSGMPHESIATSMEEPLVLEARHFVSAILDGAPIPTDAAEGRAVVATLEAGYRSLRADGETVAVGPRAVEARPDVGG
jgi:UDP-2-acetamido-3-amino-2,3-dideoxy-glucuronate N-acetyltransferase